MPQPTFRPFLTEPGEPLLSSLPPYEAAVRLTAFVTATGLSPDAVVSTPTCTMPLPLYVGAFPPGTRRFAGVRADLLWHPVFWLPLVSYGRVELITESGSDIETDEQWAARVAIELTATGLYDQESGTWYDVLAQYGIDITTDDGVARVQAWLDGGQDLVLDTIDLSSMFSVPEDQSWSAKIAHQTLGVLRPTSWVMYAESLLADANQTVLDATSDELPDDTLRHETEYLAHLSRYGFSALPGDDPEFWSTIATSAAGHDRSVVVEDDLRVMITRLLAIRDTWSEAASASAALATVATAPERVDNPWDDLDI